jgi:two-component system chemotaxis sensor kinase CheA
MDSLEQIKVTFFQECEELLADLETGLLALEAGDGDADTINAVFRAVHSVKGGAGAFGFEALVAFAHIFETALDAMRSGALAAAPDVIKAMLRASDVLADHVQAAKGEGVVDAARAAAMAHDLSQLTASHEGAVETQSLAPPADVDEWGFAPLKIELEPLQSLKPADWRLAISPRRAMHAKGHDAFLLLRELSLLGAEVLEVDVVAMPSFEALDPEDAWLQWRLALPGDTPESAIREIFDFVGDDCPIELVREEERAACSVVAGAASDETIVATDASMLSPAPAVAAEEPSPGKAATKAAPGATIRVDLERVDRLIDLVGELVINQAMLAQRVGESDVGRSSSVAIGLDELEQLTREIQDSVMAIRAQPVKSVFQRMPRLVREIAETTGKKVRLITEGENTEVDKTVIERLSDPITHMLRNAIDHGLEKPEDRLAFGKAEEGTVRLSALHRSGRIVIEVADDGKGINRERVRAAAVTKGLIGADAALTNDEIDNLIFLPGFSTASSVSNISGRGVGMDVVKRSIQSLGGRISISSDPGKGSTFTLSLPLTLAVLDGMVVSVGSQTLVAPLTAIVETLRPKPSDVRTLGPKRAVLAVRGAHVPLIDIGVTLGWRAAPVNPSEGVVLLVESELGGRAALVVDAIQGQRQVVIKSLEANYQRVEAVAAATILGDGRVALILDVDAVIEARTSDLIGASLLAKAS